MNKYILVEGLDGSGTTLFSNVLKELMDGEVIDNKVYKKIKEPIWWNQDEDYIFNDFLYYIESNIKTGRYARNLLDKTNVIQTKGLITTFISHSYFIQHHLKKMYNILMKRIIFPDCIFIVVTSIENRKDRLQKRDKITEFDRFSLTDDYDNYFYTTLSQIKSYLDIPVIYFENNSDSLMIKNKVIDILEKNDIYCPSSKKGD